MNILEVNNTDIPGRRFNGYDLQLMFNRTGHHAKQIVLDKISDDDNVVKLFNSDITTDVRYKIMAHEDKLSMQMQLSPFGYMIMQKDAFKSADVVHYHLVHNKFLSLSSMVSLFEKKPSIWTIHDAWALTGHCIYNFDCTKWRDGCNECAHLDRMFFMNDDKASQMWKIKKEQYEKMDADIVVASSFMYDMVKNSPLMSHFSRVHIIPFGIDLELFNDKIDKNNAREELNIPKDDIVLFFRVIDSGLKGIEYIKKALEMLKTDKNITILTCDTPGYLNNLKFKYNIIELEWIKDDDLLAKCFAACDMFLMPSVAEAFGLMAIEAMACARPIIVFEGTSLPSVTFAPECGIAVKNADSNALMDAILHLINNKDERERRGKKGRELAKKHYSIDDYHKKIMELYQEVASRI